jgi:hypothetical protein
MGQRRMAYFRSGKTENSGNLLTWSDGTMVRSRRASSFAQRGQFAPRGL